MFICTVHITHSNRNKTNRNDDNMCFNCIRIYSCFHRCCRTRKKNHKFFLDSKNQYDFLVVLLAEV